MKAAVANNQNQPPTYEEHPDPQPVEGTEIAEVLAASLKNIDRGLLSGQHYGSKQITLPRVAGIDGVARLADGRRVYAGATPPHGFMAEHTVINAAQTVVVPEGVDDATAAALPNPGLSAWFALEYAGQIQAGQSVLVLGGTGVTGGMAVQLAKAQFGAGRVVVAGRDRKRLQWATERGADAVIDLTEGGLRETVVDLHAGEPFDLVLDYLWGEPAEQTLLALEGNDLGADFHRTRYVQIGSMAGPTINLPASVLRSAGVELVGQGGGSIPREAMARVAPEILPALFDLAATGSITIEIERHHLSEVSDIWNARTPSGARVVFTP